MSLNIKLESFGDFYYMGESLDTMGESLDTIDEFSYMGISQDKHNVDSHNLKIQAQYLVNFFETIAGICDYHGGFSIDPRINIQPTTAAVEATRKAWIVFGLKTEPSIPIQYSATIAPASGGYSKESFDLVTEILKEKIDRVNQVFQDAMTLKDMHDVDQLTEEGKDQLKNNIQPARDAFKAFVASRLGLHRWARNIKKWNDNDAVEKISKIGEIIELQNQIISGTYLKALLLKPYAKKLFFGIDYICPQVSEEKEIKVDQELRKFVGHTKEFLSAINNVYITLEKYKTELNNFSNDPILSERLQVSAYNKVLASAKEMYNKFYPIYQSLNLKDNPTNEQIHHVINEIYHSFIASDIPSENNNAKSANTFLSLLISATTDIADYQNGRMTRGDLKNMIMDGTAADDVNFYQEIEAQLPNSKNSVWQSFVFQKVASHLKSPLIEIKNAVVALKMGRDMEVKMAKLVHHFNVMSVVANNSSKRV